MADQIPIGPSAEMAEKNKQMGRLFLIVGITMFIFGFASIPLYRIVCDSIDPGGSAYSNGTTDSYDGVSVDAQRTLTVQMSAEVNKTLPWGFETPEEGRVKIHPGERRMVKFWAKNYDKTRAIKGKAVYDINPPEAGQYFKKIECFCFKEQELGPGEEVEMPLVFWFDPEMPQNIKEVSIAYTFFNMDSSLSRSMQEQAKATGR